VQTPLVFQWNKRDLPEVMPVDQMNEELNPWNAPALEAVAVNGKGVMQTLKQVAALVFRKLSGELGA
jgi:signal recognition particle receptor subunit beta